MPIGRQKGQAIILVLVALSLVFIAIIALAVDGSQLYAQRQMAQAAADAAAQAGMLSIYAGTNTSATYSNAFGTADFNCAAGDTFTPCAYARKNGFDPAKGDTVNVKFPATEPGINNLTKKNVTAKVIRVTIIRPVKTSLMQFLGPKLSRVAAQATAAIVDQPLTPPIIVTHPTLPASFFISGGPSIQVCGGPSLSIQVNSTDPGSISLNGSSNLVDLSKAGPADDGFCNKGTGASFGDFGGPSPYPNSVSNAVICPGSGLCLGAKGQYQQPNPPILDPLADVPVPLKPTSVSLTAPTGTYGGPVAVPNGVDGCPSAPKKACVLYLPGLYTNTGINVTNQTALFAPGIYYIPGGGFGNAANGDMLMAACNQPALPGFPNTGTTADADTGCGMMVYNTGNGVFNVGANSSASLLGPPDSSVYKGILFFEDRDAPANATKKAAHTLGGGGALQLIGTIYLNNSINWQQSDVNHYQRVLLQGTPGQQTLIRGEIIVNVLEMGGNAGISMQLDPGLVLLISKVALVR